MKNKNPARKTKGSTHQKNHPILTLPTLLPGGVLSKIEANKRYFLIQASVGTPMQPGYFIFQSIHHSYATRDDLTERFK